MIPQKRGSRVAEFFEDNVFGGINEFWLKMRARLSGKPYVGTERRGHSVSRRQGRSAVWAPSSDALRAVERENRLASNEVRLNLRFPSGSAQRKGMQTTGGTLILSNKTIVDSNADSKPSPLSLEPVSEPLQEGMGEIQNGDETSNGSLESDSVIVQNEAAAAISHLSDEDKLVPPEPPVSPPSDVLIGGVSIVPPLEDAPEGGKK
jgi:hypothetical protein